MATDFPSSISELSAGLKQGEFSSVELTEHYLARIKSKNDDINAFITVCDDLAMDQARAADGRIARGESTALTGIPYANKDIFCTAGVRTSCGSKMLDNWIAPYDAHVVERLNADGLVMLGKTNMDEFAMGSSNENSFYGPVKNPWDRGRVAGGSSGGSAAAVAASMCPIATGTDTGGSIRQPAAFCGVSGIKPTYGRVSRYGMIAFASSLDQGGAFGRSAADVALMLNSMSGYDARDSTSVQIEQEDFTRLFEHDFAGLRIGLPSEYFGDELPEALKVSVEAAAKTIESFGAKLQEISLPNSPLAIPAYYVIAPAEASSNLSRYDGVRFGHRCDAPEDLQDLYERSRGEGFGAEVKRRILVGTYALSSGYYDAYYDKAQRIRRLIKDDFVSAFNDVDVILGPTTPTTAFSLGEHSHDPVKMYLADIFTTAVNLAGLPALSVPCGRSPDGMPIGLQLIGNYMSEAQILALADRYQGATDWHTQVAEIG